MFGISLSCCLFLVVCYSVFLFFSVQVAWSAADASTAEATSATSQSDRCRSPDHRYQSGNVQTPAQMLKHVQIHLEGETLTESCCKILVLRFSRLALFCCTYGVDCGAVIFVIFILQSKKWEQCSPICLSNFSSHQQLRCHQNR